jgi:O-antigen biosynthesis alpha-1,2-rhamnosyltransferase
VEELITAPGGSISFQVWNPEKHPMQLGKEVHRTATGVQPRLVPRRIFIDASYTLCSGKNSGIERVVRSIIRESSQNSSSLLPQLVVVHEGEFFAIDEQQVAALAKPAKFQRNVLGTLPKLYQKAARLLCQVLPLRVLRKWLLPEAGHLGIFKVPHSIYERYSRKAAVRKSQRVEPADGDLFLLPDAYWVQRGIWSAVENAKAAGAMIALVIYDLIPITHGEFVNPKRTAVFKQYLHQVAMQSDLIVAISETVRDQLVEYLKTSEEAGEYCKDIRSFELGAELSQCEGMVRAQLTELFDSPQSAPPYLMVATFDPRKNHRYLLNAFEILWRTRPDLRLCLIGRIGWMCEELLIELEKHPKRDRELFVFHDLSDPELHYCYRKSRGVLFPSIVEGFGLPIVESLWHGQKTFASDTPIHREVGREDCTYFDLDNPQTLVARILDWESQLADGKPQLPVRQPTTWCESNTQLFQHCLDAFDKRHRCPPLRRTA